MVGENCGGPIRGDGVDTLQRCEGAPSRIEISSIRRWLAYFSCCSSYCQLRELPAVSSSSKTFFERSWAIGTLGDGGGEGATLAWKMIGEGVEVIVAGG